MTHRNIFIVLVIIICCVGFFAVVASITKSEDTTNREGQTVLDTGAADLRSNTEASASREATAEKNRRELEAMFNTKK